MIARDNDKGDFEPTPEGPHVARSVQVVDLGTQHNERYNVYQRKVLITFELPEERIEIENEETGETESKPRFISRRFTLSLGANAHLTKFLINWRGRQFTPKEKDGFNMKNVVDKPALLQVVHNDSKDGKKTYANIDSIMKLPKSMEEPELENEPVYFSFDDVKTVEDVDTVLENLPEWIGNIVEKSVEYKDLLTAANKDKPEVEDPEDEDIPF